MANDYDSLLLLLKDKTIDLKDAQEYQEQLKRDIGQWEGIVKQRENEILSLQNEYKQSEAVNRQTVSSLEAGVRSVQEDLNIEASLSASFVSDAKYGVSSLGARYTGLGIIKVALLSSCFGK